MGDLATGHGNGLTPHFETLTESESTAMVGWAPVLERHEPLAPEGPPASSSEPVAPIIRRHSRGRGTGGGQTDAWVDSTGRVRQIPGALGTRSAEGWRDADETPSATAARIAAETAARFDENHPMPGERVDTEDSGLEASDPDAAFRGLPSWLEDESAEETAPVSYTHLTLPTILLV